MIHKEALEIILQKRDQEITSEQCWGSYWKKGNPLHITSYFLKSYALLYFVTRCLKLLVTLLLLLLDYSMTSPEMHHSLERFSCLMAGIRSAICVFCSVWFEKTAIPPWKQPPFPPQYIAQSQALPVLLVSDSAVSSLRHHSRSDI